MQLSSHKNTILVVSDVHQDVARLDYILEKENYDMVLCLGDWFDSHIKNRPEDVRATCEFLKKWFKKSNFYTLMGNHDVQYLYPNDTVICTGYDLGKDMFITEFFGHEMLPIIRQRFLWYIWLDDFLCTHAGVHQAHFRPDLKLKKPEVTAWLDTQIESAEACLETGQRHWLYSAGRARGGRYPYGGINWLDFNSEFEPIDGLKQIVGHTASRVGKIRTHETDGRFDIASSENLCIDCHLQEYLSIFNGKVTIKRTIDL